VRETPFSLGIPLLVLNREAYPRWMHLLQAEGGCIGAMGQVAFVGRPG